MTRAVTLLMMAALCACPDHSDVSNQTEPTWVKQHTPHAEIALVFVHGIFGDTLGTWTNSAGTSFFSLLEQNDKVGPKVDLYAFGYTSKMFESGSSDMQEAANTLHERLRFNQVLDYPALVFVAHSMGGLVVLRELLTQRALLEKTRLLVFYATPQEGADIANIARHVANNPALEQLLPADKNGYLRLLNDEWRALPVRPPVRCAYEKRKTHGLQIVTWTSATRFCDGTPLSIDTDHIDIVKPSGPNDDVLVLLINGLDETLLSQQLTPKLETPDFSRDGERLVLTMSDPFGKRDARMVNAGGGELSFTLAEFPDRGLFVLPGTGPIRLPAKQTQILQFVLGFGASEPEYKFVLQNSAGADREVLVRVPDLQQVQVARDETAAAALRSIEELLDDESQQHALQAKPANAPDARATVVEAVRSAVKQRGPALSESAQYVLAAELFDRVNWPDFAATALEAAAHADPEVSRVPSVRYLAARSAGLSGKPKLLDVESEPLEKLQAHPASPFTGQPERERANKVASQLKRIPSLNATGRSLQGDLEFAAGDRKNAIRTFKRLPASPSAAKRLEQASH